MRTNRQTAMALISAFIMFSSGIMVFDVSESDANPANVIEVSYDHGQIIDKATGLEYKGGEFLGEITLQFIPNRGYEFISWHVNGSAVYSTALNEITITSVQGTITVTVTLRNYSTSQELINVLDVDDLPDPDDELVLAWSFKSTQLEKSGGMWKGMPCTPLIVDHVAYVRAGPRLYALDIESGSILNCVMSYGYTVDYYHYLSYGNGIIFDTVGYKAYDLELNYLYDIPSNLKFVSYHEGYFYGCLDVGSSYYVMYKTSADIDSDLKDNVKQNLFSNSERFKVFAQYGQFSNVLFVGDWFFFLQADMHTGTTGYRAISAFNIKTEESVTCRLTGFEGMPWDDGWLTYYDGYFYLTAYTAGLFGGVIKGLEDKKSSIMWVKFDFENGQFEEPSYKNIQNTKGGEFAGIASGLVIYNGRGYLNVRALGTDTLGGSNDTGAAMIAYEIGENGEPFPKGFVDSAMTHGGIVVNVAHADEGKIYIYMIPYNAAGQALYVFTDELIDGEWVLRPRTELDISRTGWCSQCIRAGPNGEMLFYVDSGYIDCYVPADQYRVNVITVDGNYAKSETECGKNVQEILKKLYPSIEINGKNAIIGDKYYSIYGLNEVTNTWVSVTNPSVGTYSGTYKNGVTESTFRQIVLLEQNSSMTLPEDGEKGWYYFDGGYKKVSFNDIAALRASTGCSWFYLDSKPSDDSALIEPVKQVNRDDTVTLNLPELVTSTYEVSDDSIISVVREGNVLNITGLKEKTAQIIITIEEKQYVISVNVLPKIEHTLDGKTITTSDKEETTADGGSIHTLSKTTESEAGLEKTVSVTVKDSLGNTVSERISSEERYKSITMDNKESDVVKISERLTEGGVVTVDTLRLSETITTRVDIGVTSVYITESKKDNLAGTNDITYTDRMEYPSYTISTVTVEHYDGISETPVTDPAVTVYDSKQADFAINIHDGTIVINLDENGSVDVTGLISAAVDDTSVKEIRIDAGAIVNAKSVSSAADAGANLVMDTGSVTISMGAEALKALATAGGNVKFAAEPGAKMTAKQQSAAGDGKVFTINLSCGDVEQHDFGKFTLTIACDITLQDGKELKVWRIDDYGKKTYATNVTYSDGKVSFDADHLSIYAIGYESESSGSGDGKSDNGGGNGNTLMFAGIGAIAVLALLGAVFMMRRRH